MLTSLSWSISPSGANMDWTINLCLFFSVGSYSNGCKLTKNKQIVVVYKIYIYITIVAVGHESMMKLWPMVIGGVLITARSFFHQIGWQLERK